MRRDMYEALYRLARMAPTLALVLFPCDGDLRAVAAAKKNPLAPTRGL